jgi:hypothetical protein
MFTNVAASMEEGSQTEGNSKQAPGCKEQSCQILILLVNYGRILIINSEPPPNESPYYIFAVR